MMDTWQATLGRTFQGSASGLPLRACHQCSAACATKPTAGAEGDRAAPAADPGCVVLVSKEWGVVAPLTVLYAAVTRGLHESR
jgi:hypothetical protein